MRAWTHTQHGKPSEVLRLQNKLPVPVLTSTTQMLVKVSYAALNPGGSIMMQLFPTVFRTKPCIPELDFSGHVVQIGKEVSPDSPSYCSVGDAVFGSVLVGAHLKGSGALAEYVVADTAGKPSVLCLPVKKENLLPLAQAAGLSVAGCTALTLTENAKLKDGMYVLINSAGGGIGSFVVQMVRKAIGAEGHIVAISRIESEKVIKDLGADEVSLELPYP